IFGVIGDKPKAVVEIQQEAEDGHATTKVVKDRLTAVAGLIIASVFFFLAFEPAGGSMTMVARNYTPRVLEGTAGTTFKWVDALLTLLPILVVTFVLMRLASKIVKEYPLTIIFTLISFFSIMVLGVWKIHREFTSDVTEVTVAWFQILNAFFIVTLASSFSKFWEKVWNPSGSFKCAMGLISVVDGFLALSYGSLCIP